jgi:hypothetical protein
MENVSWSLNRSRGSMTKTNSRRPNTGIKVQNVNEHRVCSLNVVNKVQTNVKKM